MKLNDTFDLSNTPFQGDCTVEWRRIPAGARIERATAVVTPTAGGGQNPFAEIIRFRGTEVVGDLGATKTVVPSQWVEVDFHGRRTLARVKGTGLTDTAVPPNGVTLQVDLGGAYAEVNSNGALRSPNDPPFQLSNPSDGFFALPAMSVAKFKLTSPPMPPAATRLSPDVTEVTIRSVPANISLRFGETPVFWTRVGELAQPETTPDYSASLQAFLNGAKIENDFYVVPLVLHSDTVARLKVDVEVEFLIEQSALPPGLNEVTLPYDFDGLPKTTPELLTITAPAGARIVPQASRARVIGSFADTRIVYNPTETVSPEGFVIATQPAGKVTITNEDAFAQPISLDADTAASAIDLLLEIKQTVRLRLDIREDLDGKPGEASLLPKAVDIELAGPVGLEQVREAQGRQRWISVPLLTEFQFKSASKQKRYWLTLQSLEGEADWSVATARLAPQPAETVSLQRLSQRAADAALAWRDAAAVGVDNPLAAFFRLRHLPKRFTMPIALQVGAGDTPVRVGLNRFQDQGRVDFALDFEQVEQARQKHLSKAAVTCAEVDHLVNGDFEKWLAIGNEIGDAVLVSRQLHPLDFAVAPDGSSLFLVNRGSELQIVDALCGASRQIVSTLPIVEPLRIIISRGRTRGCIANSTQFSLLDTSARKILGEPIGLDDGSIQAMAFSPEGGRLYFITSGGDAGTRLRAVDIVKWEELISSNQSVSLNNVTLDDLTANISGATDLAVAPDGRSVYVVIDNGSSNNGSVEVFDATTFASSSVAVGQRPIAIAITPDGKRALVANNDSKSVSLIDTTTLSNVKQFQLLGPPFDLAISPDGTRVYVGAQLVPSSGSSQGSVSSIDLVRQTVADDVVKIQVIPRKLVLAPQGERIFVFDRNSDSRALFSIQLGEQLPTEWNLTSGRVSPTCLPNQFNRAAMLEGQSQRSEAIVPAALSQITPVAGTCTYDFSFWAIADDQGAMAEVFWLSNACGLLRTDSVPIKAAPETASDDASGIISPASVVSFRSLLLELHRVRLTAPEKAEQAEIRFSTPAGVTVIVDLVSLMGTTDSVTNGDFQVLPEGQIEGWTFLTGATPGLTVIAANDGLQINNAGASVVELAQTATSKDDHPFKLDFQGQVTAAAQLPSLEARWLKADGSAAGTPTVIELRADAAGSATAQGRSPRDASQVEIRLVLPPGARLKMKSVSLRFPETVSVPITFVAQAPGELAISDLQISFEEGQPTRPPIPERGLCPPTPPGGQPGTGKLDCGFCICCGAENQMTGTRAAVTDAGRPARIGNCADCGAEMVSFSGTLVANAPRFSLSTSARQPAVIRSEAVRAEAAVSGVEELAGLPIEAGGKVLEAQSRAIKVSVPRGTPLTRIKGITKTQAAELKKIGINSAEALAAAPPRKIEKVKGFSPAIAKKLITAAKTLIKTL
jgi:YVTN family beta-propeller protein